MKPLLILSLLGLLAFAGMKGATALQEPAASRAPAGPPIAIYLDPSDPIGWEAEAFFRGRGLRPEVWDVTQNAHAHAEYIRMGGGPLPVVRIGPERLSGFDRRTAERVLDRLERAPLVR